MTDLGETLAMIALSHDCGVIEKILSANAIGIEWKDSHGDEWFMQWPSVENLFFNWNGVGLVNWFFDGQIKAGGDQRCIVRVPPAKMLEIRECHARIKRGSIDG